MFPGRSGHSGRGGKRDGKEPRSGATKAASALNSNLPPFQTQNPKERLQCPASHSRLISARLPGPHFLSSARARKAGDPADPVAWCPLPGFPLTPVAFRRQMVTRVEEMSSRCASLRRGLYETGPCVCGGDSPRVDCWRFKAMEADTLAADLRILALAELGTVVREVTAALWLHRSTDRSLRHGGQGMCPARPTGGRRRENSGVFCLAPQLVGQANRVRVTPGTRVGGAAMLQGAAGVWTASARGAERKRG